MPRFCFNPCSLGWFARSDPGWKQVDLRREFQSLFSWMIRSKCGRRKYSWYTSRSFNPCSLGWFARRIVPMVLGRPDYWFQSLFSWMIRSKPENQIDTADWSGSFNPCSLGWFARRQTPPIYKKLWEGFNPCSLGWFARSRNSGRIRARDEFQSLFSWMIRSKRSRACIADQLHPRFQSLFSWMIRSKASNRRVRIIWVPCFNPCSLGWFARRVSLNWIIVPPLSFNPCSLGWFARRGCCCPDFTAGRVSILVLLDDSLEGDADIRVGPVEVSILVLLDDSLEVFWTVATPFELVVSILVLLDDSLEDIMSAWFTGISTSFNPCSLGWFARSKCCGISASGYT